jgi:adenosylcobinamide-GDP ribazoletransferase
MRSELHVTSPASRTTTAARGRIGEATAGLLAAVALLTRLPVRTSGEVTGGWAYGIVGCAIGGVGALAIVVLGGLGAAIAASVAIGMMVVVSGGLHLDGLADTADALVAPTPEAAERARADPRVGPAGVAALVLVLTLEWSLLATLLAGGGVVTASAGLVVAGAISRALAPLAAVLYGRSPRPGFGRWFTERITTTDAVVAPITAIALATAAGVVAGHPTLAMAAVVGLLLGLAVAAALARLRRGLDGDGFGASIELAFAATLLAAVALS